MATALATQIITKQELVELRELEKSYSDASKKAAALEKDLKFRRLALAEKVLGVTTADELKVLSIEQVQKLYAKRQAAGLWELGWRAPVFAFELVKQGAYPPWKELFIAEMGETAANKISAETPVTYSYRIEVANPN
jgi:hypothetical protein